MLVTKEADVGKQPDKGTSPLTSKGAVEGAR